MWPQSRHSSHLRPPEISLALPLSTATGWFSRLSTQRSEFDAVHVIHAADGNFPSVTSLGTPEGLEEERRLFYVAITRARKKLAIYVPLPYHHDRVRDDQSWAQPSRFLRGLVRLTLLEIPATDAGRQSPPPLSAVVIDGSGVVAGQLSKLW